MGDRLRKSKPTFNFLKLSWENFLEGGFLGGIGGIRFLEYLMEYFINTSSIIYNKQRGKDLCTGER